MGSARAWPRAGVARFCRAGGRRAGNGSRFHSRRSTEDPDGFSAPAASSSARTRVRHSPLPQSRPPPPLRTFGHDLDGQPNGPTTDGTDRPQASVVRGGPQSFAPPATGAMAAGDSGAAAGLGSGHPRSTGGLRRQLRGPSIATSRLARDGSRCRVSDASAARGSASHSCLAHPRVSGGNLTRLAAEMPVHSLLLPIRARGCHQIWCAQGHLAGGPPPRPLPSVSPGRVRSRPLTL